MILVSGSLAYDYIMDFPGYFRDHILPEKLHVLSVSFLIDKMKKNYGGTAGNIAYNLALLKEGSSILSSAGNDFTAYSRKLRAKGIDISNVRQVKNVTTAAAYIMTDTNDCQIIGFYPGAMNYSCKRNKKKAELAIVAPGNLNDMKALPKLYKKTRLPYIYDPGQNIVALSGNDLKNGISGSKVFISNDYELSVVLKKTKLTKKQLSKKTEILVTTLGEKGSVIEVGLKKYKIPPAKPKNTSDPTGAGDAYRAGFIKGLLMGLSYDKIGKLAGLVSVYTVEKYGTQTHTFTWAGLMKRYKENYKQSL